MAFAKFITGLAALVWMGYGIWLIYDPTNLSYIGLQFTHWSVTVEVFAMYGFAELGLGIFALLGILQPKRYLHANLVLWFLIFTGLWVGRIIGIALFHGEYTFAFGAAGLPAGYNPGTAYFYEFPFSVMFAVALWQTRNNPEI
ncbi:MAG TPA: hypothetical protein PLF22_06860 [Pseudomonadales bacterium]|nr:hypothetical protein [Pseudomonadales bacterium]